MKIKSHLQAFPNWNCHERILNTAKLSFAPSSFWLWAHEQWMNEDEENGEIFYEWIIDFLLQEFTISKN